MAYTPQRTNAAAHILGHVLLALAAVIALGQALGGMLRYLGQPPVIGEVLAGILLGPSFLGGAVARGARFCFPRRLRPTLGVLAQIGVIFYMFVVGLEFDAGRWLTVAMRCWRSRTPAFCSFY